MALETVYRIFCRSVVLYEKVVTVQRSDIYSWSLNVLEVSKICLRVSMILWKCFVLFSGVWQYNVNKELDLTLYPFISAGISSIETSALYRE